MLVLSINDWILRAASNFLTAYVMNSFADLCFTTYSILISPRSVENVSPASDHTFAWRHVSCLTLIPPTRSNDGLQSASINQSRPNVSPQPSRRLENRKENKTDSPSSYLCLKTLPCCVNIFSQNQNFKSLKCWLQWINWQQPDHGIDTKAKAKAKPYKGEAFNWYNNHFLSWIAFSQHEIGSVTQRL